MLDETDLDVGLTTGALRAILGDTGPGRGRAEDLARRLGDAIRVGLVLEGERLPSEARLSSQLGVASVTLREVLRILRGEGLITTRRGRGGGTFVTAPPDRERELDLRLDRLSIVEIRDLGDHRAAVFAAAAERAAQRAMSADVSRLQSHVDRFRAGRHAGELRRADSWFTVEVAVAGQSPRLAREDLRLRAEVGDLLWLDPAAEEVERAGDLRMSMVAAIAGRDSAAARRHATDIIASDTYRLADRRRGAYERDMVGSPTLASVALEDLEAALSGIFTSLGRLADRVCGLVGSGSGQSIGRRDLRTLRPDIEDLLDRHSATLIGAGIVVEPGLLVDVDRWLEWLWRRSGGRPEVLRVNLDPAAPDFFDYAATQWFERARASGRAQVAASICGCCLHGRVRHDLVSAASEGRYVPRRSRC